MYFLSQKTAMFELFPYIVLTKTRKKNKKESQLEFMKHFHYTG